MKIKYLVLLLLLVQCKSTDFGKGQNKLMKTNIPLPMVTEMQIVDLTPGTRNGQLKLTDQSNWTYRMHVPEYESGMRLPLIIALHWSGGDRTYLEYSECLAEPGLGHLNGIIFTPSAGRHSWWEENLETRLLRFIELAKAHWPIDPNKILITGYSNGGIGTWHFAQQHPELFSVALPMAASANVFKKSSVPFYVIHGLDDELFSASDNRQAMERAEALGTRVKLMELPEKSHFMACQYADALRMAGDWVLREIWTRD